MTSPTMRAATRPRIGFTLIELLTVVVVVGAMMAIAVPKLRISPETEVQLAGMQLAQDLDLTRTRALSTRSLARVRFATGTRAYSGYLDDNGDGTVGETVAERIALRGFQTRSLPARVTFGRGSASSAPETSGSGAVTFDGGLVDFDSRGLTFPMGSGGVVYLQHETDASAVVAVAVSPAGSVRLWTWHNGAWR